MNKDMILKPRLSEKAYGQSQALNTYVFVVPSDATKHTVGQAVANQFEVTVTDVHILNVKGKAKRTISAKGRRVANGRQSDFKKAYVTLKEGDSLPLFAAAEEAEAKTEKLQEQVAKQAEKQEKKEAKKAEKEAKKTAKEEK